MRNGSARRQTNDDGYTLVGLLIVVAVINISFAVAMTSWKTIDQRAREAELIWRGEQIARAIACHDPASQGELERLDQLVEGDCLRRVYPDPLTADGKWRILRRSDLEDGTVAALLGTAPPPDRDTDQGPIVRAADDLTSGATSRGGRLVVDLGTAGRGGQSLQERLQGGSGASGANVIIGVMSNAKGPAFRTHRAQTVYEKFIFLGVDPAG